MKDVISVDTILQEHREWMRGIRTDHLIGTSHKETKEALYSLLISKLPGKKPLVFEKEYSTPRELLPQEQEIKLNTNHQVIGFNSAIDDMRKEIDGLFEVQK